GTQAPFQTVGSPWVNPQRLLSRLRVQDMAGLAPQPISFMPRSLPGRASAPKLQGRRLGGAHLAVRHWRQVDGLRSGIAVFQALHSAAQRRGKRFLANKRFLTLLTGSARFTRMLLARTPPQAIAAAWDADVRAFRRARAPFLITAYDVQPRIDH
ncbi:MAG: hypothetical protein AAGF32_09960, partial [Pseudomonadota bacterium]